MYLQYSNKKEISDLLKLSSYRFDSEWLVDTNKLILGDNIKVLQTLISGFNLRSKIDLVYIDPPFSTNSTFSIGSDRVSTISSSLSDTIAYKDKLTGSNFLEFLRERLVLLRELMSTKASIYLHIDYKIGHYVKVLMDEVFGVENFRNDITRVKCNPKNFKRKAYGNIKDMILFYSKTNQNTWNDPLDDFSEEDSARLFKKVDADGRRYTTIPLHAPGETKNGPTGAAWRGILPPKGRHWRSEPRVLEELDKAGLIEWSKNNVPRKKIYADEKSGKKKQDIWVYKDVQYPCYPTEKNLDLLKSIILASSDPGDLVLDCFCGSGSTLQASEVLGRKWIGIDESVEAIKVSKTRLSRIEKDLFAEPVSYQFLQLQT